MLPKLSQKAWNKIQRRVKYECDYDDIDGVMLDTMDSFMSLFDLEKYPITNDMIVSYLEKHSKVQGGRYCEPFSDAYIFSHYKHIGDADPLTCIIFNADIEMSIEEQLDKIHKWFDMDLIIIIGEIHGWWEKSTN